MKLKELKNWIDTLPEEFLEFSVVTAEEGPIADDEDEYYYRLDKPIVALNVDENSEEVLIVNFKTKEK